MAKIRADRNNTRRSLADALRPAENGLNEDFKPATARVTRLHDWLERSLKECVITGMNRRVDIDRVQPVISYKVFASELTDLKYTLDNLLEVMGSFNYSIPYNRFAGIILSAGINKIIKPTDTFVLDFNSHRKSTTVAYDFVGMQLKAGTLEIHGDVGNQLGYQMKSGGTIKVIGNAGSAVGDLSTGGRIHVDGKCGNIASARGANVYVNGEKRLGYMHLEIP